VLLAPRVVEAYVLGTLLENLNGPTVAHGEGHFRREEFGSGHAVLREDLGLRLDPLEPLRRGSYRFTSEGVPAAPCVFVERGRLLRPLLDLKYARRLGLAPTPLPLGLDTLHLEGRESLTLPEAMLAADGGVLVLAVLGVHTQDNGSGDFSLAAPQALAIRGGAVGGRLRGTLSGNLFRVLVDDAMRLVAFEDEHTPGLLVRCRFDPQ
jgi:PmbA protein